MIKLRTATPLPEMWEAEQVMAHLNCDKTTAENIMKECRQQNGLTGYGAIEKSILLDFINEKQRIEREREARYNADLAAAETSATLKEQVRTLKEQINVLKDQQETLRKQVRTLELSSVSSGKDSRSAKHWAFAAAVLSILASIVITLLGH